MLSLKKDYDKIEGEYYTHSRLFRWWHTSRFIKARNIVGGMSKNSIIVDLGCNGGNFTRTLLGLGEVVAIDISSSFIGAGRSQVKQAHFILSDVQSLPIRDGIFDLVTCLEVLEHLPKPKWVVSEAWRTLKSEGRLLVSTPDEGKRLWRFIWFFWQNIGRGTAWRHKHIYNFDKERLIRMVYPFFREISVDYVNFFLLLMVTGVKRENPI